MQEGWKYTGSLYVKSDTFTGPLTVSLASASSDLVYATKELSGISSSWQKLSFEFQPTESAANTDNVLRVTVDGASAAGQTIYFGMFSLFPPTYLGRPNGMRIDLAEALAEAKPGVWRFPGGNNLEGIIWIQRMVDWLFNKCGPVGNTIETRWKWNETVGLSTPVARSLPKPESIIGRSDPWRIVPDDWQAGVSSISTLAQLRLLLISRLLGYPNTDGLVSSSDEVLTRQV